MALKRLQLQGFKTFANRTEIEFSPGVTAIVGPNGSGKSNLVDAIRWVLGEQSPSLIRTRRSDDVIFAGSASRPAVGMAEVSITIDNSSRLLPIDFNEVTVARRAYRSGENEYLLNRARVRLRDVQDVTRALSTGYSVVGQGLIDSILSLRPEERRHLFEQAADISRYHAKRVEAERRLAQTEANLTRLSDILAELSPRLRQLERQARLAASYEAAATELRQLLRQWYGRELRQRQTSLAGAVAAEVGAAAQAQQARADLSGARGLAAELAGQVEVLAVELARLRQDRDRLRAEAAAATQAAAVLDERLLALVRERDGAEEGQREALARRERASRALELETAELAGWRGELDTHRVALADAEADWAAEAGRAQALVARLRELSEERARGEARLAALGAEADEARRQREELLQAGEARRTDLQRQQQALEGLGGERARAAAEVAALAESIAAGRDRRQDTLAALAGARAEIRKLEQEEATLRADEAGLRARLETLARLQESYAGLHAGVKAVLAAAKGGRLRGIDGVVAELIRVPAALEVAVEVALGGHAQDLVAATWADADAAIAHLKRQKAGRVTLLPLDTLRVPPRFRAPDGPGVLGIAADLVESEPRFAPVVALLLGRILVVQDLDSAHRDLKRVAAGASIVTLAGEIVRSSGALTGGSLGAQAGLLTRGRELRELPGRLDAIVRARAEAGKRSEAWRQRQAGLEADLSGLEAAIAVDEQAQRVLNQKLAEAEQALAAGRQRLSWLAEALRQVDGEREALTGREATVRRQTEEINQALDGVARAEAEVRQEQSTWEAKTAARRESVDALRVLVAVTEESIRHLEAKLETHAAAIQTAAAGMAAAAERLQRATAARQDAEGELAGVRSSSSRLEASLVEAAAALEAGDARSARLRADWDAARAREVERSEAVLEAETRHGELAVQAERGRAERDALQARAVEELGLEMPEVGAVDAEEPAVDLDARLAAARGRIQRLGTVNRSAAEEYGEVEERHRFLSSQLDDLRQAERSLRHVIGELNQVMRERFEATFQEVSVHFRRTFSSLFLGGSAELCLTDPDDWLGTGIDIVARPPGKRPQNLMLLSGGERALTAAALIFAILGVNPAPFCLLDEVDAALDEANVVRFGDHLRGIADHTQFVVITHNRGTIQAADAIYGVTMGDDSVSSLISLRLSDERIADLVAPAATSR